MKTGTFALTLIVPLVLAAGCHEADVRAKIAPPTHSDEIDLDPRLIAAGQVHVEPVAAAVEAVTMHTSGKVGFNEDRLSYVASPLVGRVLAIQVRPGDRVTAGQVLATIDCPDLGAAWSEFIKARADLVLAERTHALAQQLLAAKAMARKDYQKAEDDFVKAKADLRRTRERLLSLGTTERELDASVEALHVHSQYALTAPIAGTVVARSLTLGQLVGGDSGQGQHLFTIADLRTLWVTADVYEKDLPLIQPGEEVVVRAGAWPDREFTGHLDYVSDVVDANTRTVKIRLAVDNASLLLKPEMFVTVAVHTSTAAPVLTVPIAAVHGTGGAQPFVFTAVDGTHFTRRSVSLGAHYGDRVTITSGLSGEDRVVTDGSILLKAEADRQSNS